MESGSSNGCGKITTDRSTYTTKINGPSYLVDYDGEDRVLTLHYFCIDEGTKAYEALTALKKEQKSKDNTVTFYVSSVKKDNGTGRKYYSLQKWFTRNKQYSGDWKQHGGWGDRNVNNYRAHYNNKFVIELPTVKVIQKASLVGSKLTTSSTHDFYVQDTLNQKSNNSRYVRKVQTSDYFFRPDGEVLTVDGKEGRTEDYVPFDTSSSGTKADPVELKSPLETKNTTDPTITYTEDGVQKSAVLVGFTVYKNVDTNDDDKADKKIFLANCMIDMKKDSSGQWRPKYVEERDKLLTQDGLEDSTDEEDSDSADPTSDGKTNNEAALVKEDIVGGSTVSTASNVLDRHVTVKKYAKYKKNGDKKAKTKSQNMSLREWANDLNAAKNSRTAFWLMIKKLGIRNEDHDVTKDLVVDWLYAPVDSSLTVTLEQYYVDYNKGSGENLKYETDELPEVDHSSDLSYKHKDLNLLNIEPIHCDTLEQVNYGDPWVSYSVKRDKNGAYKLKDGTTYPKKGKVTNATMRVTESQLHQHSISNFA